MHFEELGVGGRTDQANAQHAAEPLVVGHAAAFLRVMAQLNRVAPTDRAVLISGPTGSGKEVMAQLIHHRSRDALAPFLDINCGALPEHLVEAELFGYTKGAFTGAVATHAGHFERVGRGTLFLDEIGELPLALQPKLLRVLETRMFRPLGSTELKRFEGRVVAASHRNLEAQVHNGAFREDLYYRLAVFVLDIPGLDQRREDIPELVAHFSSLQPRPLTFSADAMARLQSHAWPGHIRQLRNLVDRLGVLADSTYITADILAEYLQAQQMPSDSVEAIADALLAIKCEDKLAKAEQILIDRAMQLSADNKSAAARMLGVSRKAVERRLQVRESRRQTAKDCLANAKNLMKDAAFREAIPLLERGLELVSLSSAQPDTQSTTFELYRSLGVCLRSVDGWLSAAAMQAHEAAFKVGNGLVSDVELTSLLFGVWSTQLMTMDLAKARSTVQEMLQRAQATGDADLSAEAHVAMANTLFWLGDSAETLACLQRGGLVPSSEQERNGPQGFDLNGLALNFEGLAAFHTGDFRRARAARARLLQRAGGVSLDHPFNRAIALQGAAWLACLFEDMAGLGPVADELETLARRHGFVFYQGVGQIFKGVFLTAQSRFEEAEASMREGYETQMLSNGGKLFYSFQAWKMGELLLCAGRPEESDRLMSQAVDTVLLHQDRAYLAELLDVQGRARMAMVDTHGAEEALRSAMSTSVVLGAVPARLNAATHLAELMTQCGRRRSARELLDKTLQTFDRTEHLPSLHRALTLQVRLAT